MTKCFLYIFIYWSKLYLLVLFKGKNVLIYLTKCVYHTHKNIRIINVLNFCITLNMIYYRFTPVQPQK